MNRTKKAISEAFWQILEEKPFNKITVHDIVERCQVNRNTFYYHFADIPALTEYSVKELTDQILQKHFEPGSPLSCITPIVEECLKRKKACLHLYRSIQREAYIRHLDDVSYYFVNCYLERTEDIHSLTLEDQKTLAHFYKCLLSGLILDWFEADMSYDFQGFCEKVCTLLDPAAKNAVSPVF